MGMSASRLNIPLQAGGHFDRDWGSSKGMKCLLGRGNVPLRPDGWALALGFELS